MFSNMMTLCLFVVMARASFPASPVHYSSALAVSSQKFVRYDQGQNHAAPAENYAAPAENYAAPAENYAAPAENYAAPAENYAAPAEKQAAPAENQAAPAENQAASAENQAAPARNQAPPAAYYPPPVQYSSAAAVSSQKLRRRNHKPKQIAIAVPAGVVYNAPPGTFTYHAVPAAVTYQAEPITPARQAARVNTKHKDIKDHPKYEYNYSVADSLTGDNKSHQESREGDVVKGSYSFQEADGSVRTVEYTADDQNGFNAVVRYSAPTAAPVHVKALPIHVAPAYYRH